MVTREQAVEAAKLHRHIRHSGIGCPAINCCTMAAYILQPDPLREAVERLVKAAHEYGEIFGTGSYQDVFAGIDEVRSHLGASHAS